jgi:hypothetical protein
MLCYIFCDTYFAYLHELILLTYTNAMLCYVLCDILTSN